MGFPYPQTHCRGGGDLGGSSRACVLRTLRAMEPRGGPAGLIPPHQLADRKLRHREGRRRSKLLTQEDSLFPEPDSDGVSQLCPSHCPPR